MVTPDESIIILLDYLFIRQGLEVGAERCLCLNDFVCRNHIIDRAWNLIFCSIYGVMGTVDLEHMLPILYLV